MRSLVPPCLSATHSALLHRRPNPSPRPSQALLPPTSVPVSLLDSVSQSAKWTRILEGKNPSSPRDSHDTFPLIPSTYRRGNVCRISTNWTPGNVARDGWTERTAGGHLLGGGPAVRSSVSTKPSVT